MTAKTKIKDNAKGLRSELLIQAEAESKNDRRTETRFPFSRAISVQVDNHSFSAFTREISSLGMGLLHNMELPLRQVAISVAGKQQRLRLSIDRCEPLGEGWYCSGGIFVG